MSIGDDAFSIEKILTSLSDKWNTNVKSRGNAASIFSTFCIFPKGKNPKNTETARETSGKNAKSTLTNLMTVTNCRLMN